jgi:lipopolysaccharide export LptBFGC system permease protein LptF
MPTLWVHLIKKFFIQFLFVLVGIIGFLLVIRFNSIAGFATSGSDISLILVFIALIIPHVLPFAFPISALSAALIISRKLSSEKHYAALRASGLSFSTIFTPLILCFFTLSVINLFVSGSLAPFSKIKSKALIYDVTLKHPLFITQKACPLKIRSMYTDTGKDSSKETAYDLVLAFKNKKNERLSLIVADKLSAKNGQLKGKNLAFISSVKSKNENTQDDLIIENEAFMTTSSNVVDSLLYKDEAVDGVDYMDLFQIVKNLGKKIYYPNELYKRVTISLAPLTFGILGLCFGINISRKTSNFSLVTAISLASVFMVTYVVGRSFRYQPHLSLMIFTASHILLLSLSMLKLRSVLRGKG